MNSNELSLNETIMSVWNVQFVHCHNLFIQFNIHCDDDYKLAFVGTLNNIGRVLLLPVTGLLSDR